jgi:hypothetical protein
METKKDFNFGNQHTMSYSLDKLKSLRDESGEGTQKHYEFWGGLISNFNLARIVIVIMSLTIGGLVALLYFSTQKPALVFKTDDAGKSLVYTPSNPDSVFSEELLFATDQFIRRHTDLNPVSVENSLELALQMTTKTVRDDLLSEIKAQDYIGIARKYKPTYSIEIGNIEVKKREHPYYTTYCIVNINFLKPKNFVRVHIYEITWRKYARSQANPSGLYIAKLDHYDQGEIKTNLNKK